MIATDRFAKVEIASPDALRDWLMGNHGQAESVWLVTWKKHVGIRYLSREEVLDALLCFGWIDGIRRRLNDDQTMQLISPRQQQAWAKSYKDRVEILEATGQMEQAGRDAIKRSKALGLWDAKSAVDALIVPSDLRDALDTAAGAALWFDNAAPSYRRNVLRWLDNAVRHETRTKRIGEIAKLSGDGRKVLHM